jgi:hypothetical protein
VKPAVLIRQTHHANFDRDFHDDVEGDAVVVKNTATEPVGSMGEGHFSIKKRAVFAKHAKKRSGLVQDHHKREALRDKRKSKIKNERRVHILRMAKAAALSSLFGTVTGGISSTNAMAMAKTADSLAVAEQSGVRCLAYGLPWVDVLIGGSSRVAVAGESTPIAVIKRTVLSSWSAGPQMVSGHDAVNGFKFVSERLLRLLMPLVEDRDRRRQLLLEQAEREMRRALRMVAMPPSALHLLEGVRSVCADFSGRGLSDRGCMAVAGVLAMRVMEQAPLVLLAAPTEAQLKSKGPNKFVQREGELQQMFALAKQQVRTHAEGAAALRLKAAGQAREAAVEAAQAAAAKAAAVSIFGKTLPLVVWGGGHRVIASLALSGNSIGDQGCASLFGALTRTLQAATAQDLDTFAGNGQDDQGMDVVWSAWRCYSVLDAQDDWSDLTHGETGQDFSKGGGQKSRSTFGHTTHQEARFWEMGVLGRRRWVGALTALDLSNNRLGAPSAQALARFLLGSGCAVHTLNLANNVIGDEGLLALVVALGRCRGVTELDLSANRIGDHGALLLAAALIVVGAPPPPPPPLNSMFGYAVTPWPSISPSATPAPPIPYHRHFDKYATRKPEKEVRFGSGWERAEKHPHQHLQLEQHERPVHPQLRSSYHQEHELQQQRLRMYQLKERNHRHRHHRHALPFGWWFMAPVYLGREYRHAGPTFSPTYSATASQSFTPIDTSGSDARAAHRAKGLNTKEQNIDFGAKDAAEDAASAARVAAVASAIAETCARACSDGTVFVAVIDGHVCLLFAAC